MGPIGLKKIAFCTSAKSSFILILFRVCCKWNIAVIHEVIERQIKRMSKIKENLKFKFREVTKFLYRESSAGKNYMISYDHLRRLCAILSCSNNMV